MIATANWVRRGQYANQQLSSTLNGKSPWTWLWREEIIFLLSSSVEEATEVIQNCESNVESITKYQNSFLLVPPTFFLPADIQIEIKDT